MRKLIVIFTAMVATVLGFGAVVNAANAYPPNGVSVVATPASGGPGYEVTVTVNCTVGESVTIALVDSSDRVSCTADGELLAESGSAAGSVVAPSSPGEYVGVVTGSMSGALGQFTITVQSGTATPGATEVNQANGFLVGDTVSTDFTRVFGGLFLVALCVAAVTVIRRREMLFGT